MARRKLYIPEEVKTEIRKHISEKYQLAIAGFFSANEEEDTLTGDLGASLRIKNQKVYVAETIQERPGTWTWSIDYHKFRGRGPGATENKLGADGLFELTLKVGNRVNKKSILFQSKIDWESDANLIKEAIKLSTWREASFILNFTANKFEAIDIDTVIGSRGVRPKNLTAITVDEFIGKHFLDCEVGDIDLRYDAVSRRIIWRSINDQMIAVRFSIPQRIAIKIVAPDITYGSNFKYDKEITVEEIHNHRMDASEEDMLSLGDKYTKTDLRKARAAKAMIYHSDAIFLGDNLLDELMKRRMQEFNAAHDFLKNRAKH